jgi:hypothetical protein
MEWKYYDQRKLNIFTFKRFLYVLGYKNKDFKLIVENKNKHYIKVKKIKRDGINYREIYKPDIHFKQLLKNINKKILTKGHFPTTIHCGPKGRSIMTATKYHKNFNHHISLDINNFFDKVTKNITGEALKNAGFNKCVANLIIQASVEDNRLPQGFPTSSILSALVISLSLIDFYKSFNKNLIILSVYADDILLSSDNHEILINAEKYIEKKLKDIGLELNKDKKVVGKKGSKFLWLGLQINPWVTVPREKMIQLQKDVYRYKTQGILPDSFKPKKKGDVNEQWKKSVRGKIQFAKMTNKNKLQNNILKNI